jgi:hypothetical protein
MRALPTTSKREKLNVWALAEGTIKLPEMIKSTANSADRDRNRKAPMN